MHVLGYIWCELSVVGAAGVSTRLLERMDVLQGIVPLKTIINELITTGYIEREALPVYSSELARCNEDSQKEEIFR